LLGQFDSTLVSHSSTRRASIPASPERTVNSLPPERVEHIQAPPSELSWTLLNENPEQAANTARDLPPSDLRTEWLRIIANDWTLANPTAALQWGNQNLNSEDREKFLTTATVALAKTCPDQAAALIATELSPSDLQTETALAILSTWFDADPSMAFGWAAEFPETLRPRAIQTLQSRASPREFAEGLPDGGAEN
jgi:hypothetical protein